MYLRIKYTYLTLCVLILCSSVAHAKQEVTIPIDMAIGPAFHMVTGPVQDDQMFHYGLRLNLEAIIDRATIKKFKKKIPKKYRKLALKLGEIRFRPGPVILIPRTLFISPGENTSIYGGIWDFIGVGTHIGPLQVGAKLQLTYAYLSSNKDLTADPPPETVTQMSDQMSSSDGTSMHLLRPGLTGYLQLLFDFKTTAITMGWHSNVYIPQKLGGGVFEMGKFDRSSIWHIGQVFITFHYRMPFKTKL